MLTVLKKAAGRRKKLTVIAEEKPLKVVIAGNPNAGKTTLFNALTRSSLRTGNFHGVTTAPAVKTVGGISYTDVPGMYSFNAYTMEEGSAAEAIRGADMVVNVVDATTLPSSLNLTENIIKTNPRTVVYLTKCGLLKRRGGGIDAAALSERLGVPVFCNSPKELKGALERGLPEFPAKRSIPLDRIYYGGNGQISRAERLFCNKFFASVFFALALIATFFITFHPSMPGAYLKGVLEELLCVKLPAAVAEGMASPLLTSFVCEGIISGMGGVLSFIPQLAVLYLALILLDESGVSSALTFVTDGLFEKAGLSGRAAFSLISGFGCTAAAISTTRGFAEESSRRKTIAVLPFIPCGAKTPVFLTFLSPLFKNPFPAVCVLYFGGAVLAIVASAVLKGRKEGLISEVAPVCAPSFPTVFKKLFFQLKSFIIKVTTYVFAFCVISWLLSHFSFGGGFCAPQDSIAGGFSRLVCYLFYPMGVTDWRIAYAAVTGFAAKENVAATIALLAPQGLDLALAPTLALCAFFLTCPACVSAFAASVREIGFKRTLIYNSAQLAFSFAAGYLTYLTVALI